MAFRDWITQWRDKIKSRRATDQPIPEYNNPTDAAQNTGVTTGATPYSPYQTDITKQQESIKSSPYLAEYAIARGNAKAGFGTQQEEAKNALNRAIATQGGTSSGQQMRLTSEMQSDLAKTQQDTLGQIDLAEAQDRTRRMERAEDLGIQKYQFDSGLNFQKYSFGQQMGLAVKESVFNQMLALKESGIKPKDLENMRTLFEGMRVDIKGNQQLPSKPTEATYKEAWENKGLGGVFGQGYAEQQRWSGYK